MAVDTTKSLEDRYIHELASLYDADEAKYLFKMVLEDGLSWPKSRYLGDRHRTLSKKDSDTALQLLEQLKTGQPIQYILGRAWFLGMRLTVGPAVLIPRPETEELVDLIHKDFSHREKPIHIIDIGTGSGCIALGLKKRIPQAAVFALDVSPEALGIARSNAEELQLPISFIEADILEWDSFFDPQLKFDIIVSNPPYITGNEQSAMHANVLAHEPHLALFVDNDAPLLFYDHISSFALAHLKPGGRLYFEINAQFGEETATLLVKKGFQHVQIHQDMQGKDRMVVASVRA